MGYTAAKQVAIGTGEADPDRPGRTVVKVYEPGDEVDVSGIDNVQALVDNGYLNSSEAPAEEAPAEEAPAPEGGGDE